MAVDNTMIAVYRYLDERVGFSAGESIVPVLLDQAVNRLRLLCSSMLNRRYPRLALMNFAVDELLTGAVERLLKALRETHPQTAAEFLILASRLIRRELNDLAGDWDKPPHLAKLLNDVAAPAENGSSLNADTCRILAAIEDLPDDERVAFDLVRIQGMSQARAAHVLGVLPVTLHRRLHSALQLLSAALSDLSRIDAGFD